jgi:hypothetical protein
LARFEQFVHVLGRRRRVAPLELHGLPRARQRADGQHAGIRVAADEIAHEKIAAMKILEVFVDDEADEAGCPAPCAGRPAEVFETVSASTA